MIDKNTILKTVFSGFLRLFSASSTKFKLEGKYQETPFLALLFLLCDGHLVSIIIEFYASH